MMACRIKKIFILLAIILALTSCNNRQSDFPTATAETPGVRINAETYPTANIGDTEEYDTYPIREDLEVPADMYPVSAQYILPEGETLGPDFDIEGPLHAGDTEVKGTGPAGVPIILIDANMLDVELARTTIDEKGYFTFTVPGGLPANHQVGIILGDVTGTDINPNDFIFNPNYSDRYLIGIMFDIEAVQE